MGVFGWVDLACPMGSVPCTCLFMLNPGILRSTLSHILCKLQLWLCIGEGHFRCSLNLSPKVLECLSYVFLITCKVPTLESIDGPTLVSMGSSSLWETGMFLMVLLPLKWVCMPHLMQILLMLLHRHWV